MRSHMLEIPPGSLQGPYYTLFGIPMDLKVRKCVPYCNPEGSPGDPRGGIPVISKKGTVGTTGSPIISKKGSQGIPRPPLVPRWNGCRDPWGSKEESSPQQLGNP